MKADWQTAEVLEPESYDDLNEELPAVVFWVPSGKSFILSLDPVIDFEINNKGVSAWQLGFEAADQTVTREYQAAIAMLRKSNYVVDEQNGSVLVRPLTDLEIANTLRPERMLGE